MAQTGKGLQDAARSVRHALSDQGYTVVGDKVASTTLGFIGRLERLTGEVTGFEARSQLGWKCINGNGKIHHEFNYTWTVEPKSIEPVLVSVGQP